jgi:NitT/TauT family transport system substrate-binding protein
MERPFGFLSPLRPLRSLKSLRVVAAASAFAFLAACGSSDGGSGGDDGGTGGGADQVTASVIPIVDVAPIYLGVEQGFFADHGIDLTLETAQGGAAILPAVLNGQVQFGFSNVTSLMVAQSQGLNMTMVTPGAAATGDPADDIGMVAVREDSDIADAADLAGRTVAVNALNNIADTTVRQVVRQAGGDPSAVEFVELPFPDMPAALEDGRVDAAWLAEPFLTIAGGQGARTVAAPFSETHPDLLIASYFTSEQLVAEDPDLVERFSAAMNESLEYASAHPDEARGILSEYTEIDEATAAEITLPTWPTEFPMEPLELLADLASQDGLVEEPVDVQELLP